MFCCGNISRYAAKMRRKHALMQEVADPRVGKFLRSMSDFKPGERTLEAHSVLANRAVQRRCESLFRNCL